MWSQRESGLSATTKVHPVRYLLQNGVNTVRYLLSNGVKVFSPEIINIAQGEIGQHVFHVSDHLSVVRSDLASGAGGDENPSPVTCRPTPS